MNTFVVVTGVIFQDNKVLLLKRSTSSRVLPNKWEFPSGFLKEFESCEDAILREVAEETSLHGAIRGQGSPKTFVLDNTRWIVIPFLIYVPSSSININRKEHQDFQWIAANEIDDFDLAIGTIEVLNEVSPKYGLTLAS